VEIAEEIQQALDRLDLPTLVTKSDIKKRYRQLARVHHPDINQSNENMERINQAYALLMEYIESFRYTFDTDEIARQFPGAEHAKKFKP
jgi:DnaJ-class molecular chaperone